MAWITIIWSMFASVCLTLAIVHGAAWFRDQQRMVHLWFALIAISVAAMVGFELGMMKSNDPAMFGKLVRCTHLPIATLVLSLVIFTRSYLRAGRPWLGWLACGLRLVALILNFLSPVNLNYASIDALAKVDYLGEAVAFVSTSTPNHFSRVAEISNFLLAVFVLDASVTAFRRGNKRQAMAFGVAMILAILIPSTHTAFIHLGLIHAPYVVGISWFLLTVILGYEMSVYVLRESILARELERQRARMSFDERFRFAVEAAPSGMLMTDAGGAITLVNSQVEKTFGYSRGELLGQPIERLVPGALSDQHAQQGGHFERGTTDSIGAGRELFGLRKNGDRLPVEIGLNPIRTPDGSFVLASIMDLTQRKKVELEMARQRNEVAHLSRVNMLGELSGSLAHELNQPLASILSNAQAAQKILSKVPVDLGELREIVDDIVSADKRAGEVIRRLRALLTKGEVQHQLLSLNDVVVDVLRLLHGDLVSHGVATHAELHPGLPRVSGDKVQLQQVLINLVVNASDAMAGVEGSDRQVSVRTETSNGDAHVIIKDQGRGTSNEELSRIFEPFMTTKKHGMGLGLTVCRSIVSAHGGQIWATRNDDRGLSLHFTIPTFSGAPA